jgi:hypothetical protein
MEHNPKIFQILWPLAKLVSDKSQQVKSLGGKRPVKESVPGTSPSGPEVVESEVEHVCGMKSSLKLGGVTREKFISSMAG